jgi:hypothetical protein
MLLMAHELPEDLRGPEMAPRELVTRALALYRLSADLARRGGSLCRIDADGHAFKLRFLP